MNIQADTLPTPHTLQIFEDELNRLHSLKIEMTQLVIYQLELSIQALDDGNMALAEQVIHKDQDVNRYATKIDSEVLAAIARHSPVAGDLRTVISTSKIAVELEKIGAEIADFAIHVQILFDPKIRAPNPGLLSDIVKISNLVKTMLTKLLFVFENPKSDRAHALLQYDLGCEIELRQGIQHQLDFATQDARRIGRTLEIMQIMKSLECCGEHCRNITEYLIFMIEGIDVRHRGRASRLNLL